MENFFLKSLSFPRVIVATTLLIYSVLFFSQTLQQDWMFMGDTIHYFVAYSYHQSGIINGEYPMWNPLVRGGEPHVIFQIILSQANLISNFVIGTVALVGIKDIVLSFSIYIFFLILVYVSGIYFLIFSWTGNRSTAAFGFILALGSSTVHFYVYHVAFLTILHPIPWALYAITMYCRNPKFRYLVILALSWCLALYSYLVFMGLTYIAVLIIAALIIYRKGILPAIRPLKSAPPKQLVFLVLILFLVTLPAGLILRDYKENFVPISRVTEIKVTDEYELEYQSEFSAIYGAILFARLKWENLSNLNGIKKTLLGMGNDFEMLYSGRIRFGFSDLRHFILPIAVPFLIAGLLTSDRLRWCIAISGVFITMVSGNIFPLSLIYHVPGIHMMRNAHFLLQYLVLAMILGSALGFDHVCKSQSLPAKIKFSLAGAFLIMATLLCVTLYATSATSKDPLFFSYNDFSFLLVMVIIPMVVLLKIASPPKSFPKFVLILSMVVLVIYVNLINQIPMLSGAINKDPNMVSLHGRVDHSLKFFKVRPDEIHTINQEYGKAHGTDFGSDEYSSLVTLKDNSYRSAQNVFENSEAGRFGISSFPMLKSYILFSSIPGSEDVLRQKFLFFHKMFISSNKKDMMAFRNNPGLLRDFIGNGVGLVDDIEDPAGGTSLGKFISDQALNNGVSNVRGAPMQVHVKEYRANSIAMEVSVSEDGLFTYTDSWYPGWKAYVDGESVPVRKVFHTFKGVELAKGTHEVKFIFRSIAHTPFLVMHVLAFILFLGLLLYPLMEKSPFLNKIQARLSF